jgi:hypothetical protein
MRAVAVPMPEAAPEMMATLPANLILCLLLLPWADYPTWTKVGLLGHQTLKQVIAEKTTPACRLNLLICRLGSFCVGELCK